ncbi:hypothetical protein [Salinivibrio sharmensis]|uniref:Uncharacterized protein n=1 Tax=Salinivibrio sharmensis TaxID=390883 RepID=A0ABX3KGV8_9GAMM|nr:hypothetical protein [Salinivibrio sharmensis]OOE87976.1 hypothetical protein BZG74_09810 [Salinivibrio sharmensis]
MKALSIILLTVQLVLIGFSHYYGGIASREIQNISTAADAQLHTILYRVQHYSGIEDSLGYLAAGAWLVTVMVLTIRKATNTWWAQLSMLLPILASFMLSFF